jgi:hypothetical protein
LSQTNHPLPATGKGTKGTKGGKGKGKSKGAG